MNYHTKTILFLCVLVSGITQAQINTASVVVFRPDQDEFVIASDSRAHWVGENLPPTDNGCKIAALKGNIVFSTTGTAAFETHDGTPGGWTNLEEASRAAELHGTGTGDAVSIVNAVADSWAESVREKMALQYASDPDLVTKIAKPPDFALTTGIFAAARGGKIAWAIRNLDLVIDESRIAVNRSHCETGHFCASGHTDVFLEFARKTTPRALAEARNWAIASDAVLRWINNGNALAAIRYVDLTIAYDLSGLVGGPIDALEMRQDGSVRWFYRKANCPENQD